MSAIPTQSRADSDPVVVLGAPTKLLDVLRLAVLRSDDVTAVTLDPDQPTRRFADRFAVDLRVRLPEDADVANAAAVLIALDDIEAENRLVRAARRRGIPVHVLERPLVSDFTLLEFLEHRPASHRAA